MHQHIALRYGSHPFQEGLIYKEVARDRLSDPLATLKLEKVPIPDQESMVLPWKDKFKRDEKSKIPTKSTKLLSPAACFMYVLLHAIKPTIFPLHLQIQSGRPYIRVR